MRYQSNIYSPMTFRHLLTGFFLSIILLIATAGNGCIMKNTSKVVATPAAINIKPGQPDLAEFTARLILMSDHGLFPRRLSASEAQVLATTAKRVSESIASDQSVELIMKEINYLDSLCRSTTGLSWEELERVKAPW